VVEDAPAGVRSGKAAAARVIAVRTTTGDQELLASGADFIVNDCASLYLDTETTKDQLVLEIRDEASTRRAPRMS
jgi:beta-phosphoglucomutase-like phosphatase (HAD superfamily)